jgi:hypothetical protein
MKIQDAGGTRGGAGSFFGGLALMGAGLYLLLRNIVVTSGFHMGLGLFPVYSSGPVIPAGVFLVAALVGIVGIFFNGKSIWGWGLLLGSVAAIVFGVITSLHFMMRPMNLLEMLFILGVLGAGIGLFLRSLRPL